MSNAAEFQTLSAESQTALQRLAEAVEGVVPDDTGSWTIRSADLVAGNGVPRVVAEVAAWEGNDTAFLYFFRLTNSVDLANVKRVYSDAKAREKNERSYARLIAPSEYFYVGSSRSISQRFKEHLGFGAKKTYALQLAHWAPPLGLELEFVCAKYAAEARQEVLQTLEDTLWERLKPMFGRQGRR